jgi:hypothetical protein
VTGGRTHPDPAVWGGLVWLLALLLGAVGIGRATLVDALLLFGVLVVVPLSVPLHPVARRSHAAVALVAGAPLAPALLLEAGLPAGVLSLPWLAAAATAVVVAASWWLAGTRRALDVVWVAAAAYLAVGAGWLVADRLDLEPAGVAAPFVQLTAIHFHFAGFAASLLAGCAVRWRASGVSILAAALIVVGPPIVALGFTTDGRLQIAGAVVLTAGLWLLAWEIVRRIGPGIGGLAGTLLIVSALATLAPMILAVQWAVGASYATSALSIPEMARWHGVTNAVGFAFLGVLAWRLAHARPPTR